MGQIAVNKKDDIVMKLLHYFVIEENYKPIILKGVSNEIWLENFDNDLKLIRININYIHNEEQFNNDLWRADLIRKNISRKTLSLKTNMLNILVDLNDRIVPSDIKNIASLKVAKLGDIKKNKLINSLFPSIKERLNSSKTNVLEFVKLSEELNHKTYSDEKKMSNIFKTKKPTVTSILIGINVLVYLAMAILSIYSADLSTYITLYGANSYVLIQSEGILGLYRLITSTFIHADILHLFFNMYALYIVGAQVERYYGKKQFLLIYFISGIVGSLFSNVFMASNAYSIGASGAIFGLFGALAFFAYNYRALLGGFLKSSLIPVITINLFLGMFIPGIDIFGHIGGLLGGILISIILGVAGKSKKKNINILIVSILLIIFMSYMLFIK